MDLNEAIYFRDLFREARAKAYRDAEAFHEILYAIEKFGIKFTNNVEGLYGYWDEIGKVAEKSPLSSNIDREWHLPFNELYELVKDARNDALHQGAFARHLTLHATQLVLILEDALMDEASKVSDFMVREPICAYIWQPLSFIRQQLLLNSFSYLPVYIETGKESGWQLIADYAVAQYLRSASSKTERKKRLAEPIGKAWELGKINFQKADLCSADALVSNILRDLTIRPILVINENKKDHLLGILTAYDLL
jgi:hypothetical protein